MGETRGQEALSPWEVGTNGTAAGHGAAARAGHAVSAKILAAGNRLGGLSGHPPCP